MSPFFQNSESNVPTYFLSVLNTVKDADCHSYIRRLLALLFLPAENIPSMMTRLRDEARHTDTYDGLLDYMQNTWIDSNTLDARQMECILQNSTDEQRRRQVAPSPEPECTERSAASLRHDSTSIPRSYHREFTDKTTITRQDTTQTIKEIQRPARKDYEIMGAVCWRPEDPEFLKIMCSPECPHTVNCSHKTFYFFIYIMYFYVYIFHIYIIM